MSRPRTPSAILDARGAFKKNPDRKREGEPEVKDAIAPPPDTLSESARNAWRTICEKAAPGVVTDMDYMKVHVAAILWGKCEDADWDIPVSQFALLGKLLGEFGFDPSSRSKLNIGKQGGDANPFDDL